MLLNVKQGPLLKRLLALMLLLSLRQEVSAGRQPSAWRTKVQERHRGPSPGFQYWARSPVYLEQDVQPSELNDFSEPAFPEEDHLKSLLSDRLDDTISKSADPPSKTAFRRPRRHLVWGRAPLRVFEADHVLKAQPVYRSGTHGEHRVWGRKPL